MRLILVRHGETEENVKRIIQGQHGALSKRGLKQAKLLAKRLKDEEMDAVISSDLKRAVDTTKEIVKFHPKIPVEYSKLLRETSFGKYVGIPVLKFKEIRKKSGEDKYKFRPEGGEDYLDLKARANKFLDETLTKYKGKTILVVTHGGIIRVLLGMIFNKTTKEASEMDIPNTCISMIEFKKKKKYDVKLLMCVGHLDEKDVELNRPKIL
jgi:broad specificity phosphatase PhoE